MMMLSEGGTHSDAGEDERGPGGLTWPCRMRGLSPLVALLLALIPVAARAGEMEGPHGGNHRLSPPPDGDYRLERIRFENDGEWLRMTIPIKAPWEHRMLADPPRIIVDLEETRSFLSKAPGLYQARLDRGPVRAVRTSQFLYSPLDHRVRIVLDLSEAVRYQAGRVGDEIRILIPDRGARIPRAVEIGPAGIAASVGEAPPRGGNGEPGPGALQYAMGEACLRAGDATAAEEHLRMVPAGDSLHVPALLLIAVMQDRRGEREAALETYRRVTALGAGPYLARGLARTADLEFQLGRVHEALASYERLLRSGPVRDEEVWAIYQAGNCHLLLGESASAMERYETIAKLWPHSFWAPFAKERLEEMTWRAQWTAGIVGP
jgi:tetratricopeptide (TPR) repeat protein